MVLVLFWSSLFLVLGIGLLVACGSLVWASLKGAPFVPMPMTKVRRVIELAKIKPGERAIDLGSGDGRLVIALAQAGAKAEGCEIQPFLTWWSRLQIRRAGLRGSATVRRGDLWNVDCSGAQVVTLYAFPSMMERLERKLLAELPKGARVVSLAFSFPTWQPTTVEGTIRVYEA